MRFLLPLGLVVAVVAVFFLLRSPDEPAPVAAGVHERLVLTFPGATGWREEDACTNVDATDACAGEWTAEQGQKARVLLLPVVDVARLAAMTAKLKVRVEEQGGVVSELDTHEGKIVRMLQPAKAEGDVDVVNITYLLPSPDRKLLHMLTSVVPQGDQVDADQRLRDLLAFAAFTRNER